MKQRLIWGATGLALVALFVSFRFLGASAPPGPDLCLFHRATGIACPACGLTRAAAALARGELAESIRLHPLFAFVAAELALAWLLWGRSLFGRPLPRRALGIAALSTAALLVAVWAVRLATGTLPS